MNLVTSESITMSSREIADLVGSRHDDVKRCINRLAAEQLNDDGTVKRAPVIQLPPMAGVKNHLGQTVSEYQICKRDSFVIVAQLSPEFTARLVDRWQELESLQSKAPALPKNFAEALRLAADQAEQIEQQQKALAIAAPKVEFVDQYVEATGSMTFRQVCKLLGANEREFREFLRANGIMYRLGGEWTAYAPHIDAGRFEVKTGTAAHNDHAYTSARFTPKGVEWVSALWRKEAA